MCLLRCNVRITGTPSGPGVNTRPGNHQPNSRDKPRRNHRHRKHRVTGSNTAGSEQGGTILATRERNTTSVQPARGDRRPAESDNHPSGTDPTSPARVRSHQTGTTDTDPEERTGRSLEETSGPRNQRGPTAGTGRYDPGRTAIWRGSPRFEDAVSECLDVSSQGGSGCSPGPGRQRPEISRLPGLFTVGSNSVERLDCSTPDGHTTQARQLSRRTVEDAVCIQPPEGNSLRTDLATREGRRNDRAGRPTSFYTTPGSSFWGPRPSSHRRTENAGDKTKEP